MNKNSGLPHYYKLIQNQINGHFQENPKTGLGVTMLIEAQDADKANKRAEQIGVDFTQKCFCCGRRWWRIDEDDIVQSSDLATDINNLKSDVDSVYVHPLHEEFFELT